MKKDASPSSSERVSRFCLLISLKGILRLLSWQKATNVCLLSSACTFSAVSFTHNSFEVPVYSAYALSLASTCVHFDRLSSVFVYVRKLLTLLCLRLDFALAMHALNETARDNGFSAYAVYLFRHNVDRRTLRVLH